MPHAFVAESAPAAIRGATQPPRLAQPGLAKAEPAPPSPAEPAGRLSLIEWAEAASPVSSIEYRALREADVILYEQRLAPFVAALLRPGSYAEALPGAADEERPLDERGLRFARDGWRVVQLAGPQRPEAPAGGRVLAAARQLIAAGFPPDSAILLIGAGDDGVSLSMRLDAVLAARAEHRSVASRMFAVQPRGCRGASPASAFTANGLAG
jgi:hypothetical protein